MFRHDKMGLYLLEHNNVCKVNQRLYIYRDGLYLPGPDAIHGAMVELVPNLSEAKRREVVRFLSVYPGTPVKTVANKRYIPFRTKVYDLDSDSFLEYSPDLVFFYRNPYDYKKDVQRVPLVDNTLMSAACSDPMVFMLLCEAGGRGLYRSSEYRGAIFFHDEHGSGGKSTILNMYRQAYGAENCSALSLQDLNERFRLAEIVGKCANIGDDIPKTALLDSSIFKKLVTGEELVAERKGEDPFTFRSTAVLFFAANSLPPVNDRSDAFYSRVIVVPFNADFSTSKNLDLSLKTRVWTTEEMEYLIWLFMAGLRRLIAQGDYTRPDCVKLAIEEYREENDPVASFLAEYGDVVYKSTQDVYDDYTTWSMHNGHRNPLNRPRFSKEVCTQLKLKTEPIRNKAYGKGTIRCFVPKYVTDVTL